MADQIFPAIGLSLESWHETEGVLTASINRSLIREFSHRGIEICQASKCVGPLPCFNAGGPTHNEGDAVATFVDVSFVSPVTCAGIMTVVC